MKPYLFCLLIITYTISGCNKEDDLIKLNSGSSDTINNRSSSITGDPEQTLLESDSWTFVNPLTISRSRHTATLLPNGKVLVAGGFAGLLNSPVSTETAELYDPGTGIWDMTGSMSVARSSHTATLLPGGKVLVVGGRLNNMATATAEVYDANAGTWNNTNPMNFPRFFHTATLLENGNVLVTGGLSQDGVPVGKSAEIYNPVNESWSVVDHMSIIRWGHSAALLENGKVLVAGGSGPAGDGVYTPRTEIYDPLENKWHNVGNLNTPRGFHASTRLDNGCVLVAGGLILSFNQNNITSTAECFNPATGKWTSTGSMFFERIPGPNGSVLLNDGSFLVAGGRTITSETYEPGTSTWTIRVNMNSPRVFHTVTKLTDGTVLAIGGENRNGFIASVELYHPVEMETE